MSQEYWDGVTRSAEVVDTWPDWKLDVSNLKSRERRRSSGEILPKPDKDSIELAQRDATIAELRAEVERLKGENVATQKLLASVRKETQDKVDQIRDVVPSHMRCWAPLDAVRGVCEELSKVRASHEALKSSQLNYELTMKMNMNDGEEQIERLRETLIGMRLNCCQLGDFMYEPVRFCSQQLIQAIDAALSAAPKEPK